MNNKHIMVDIETIGLPPNGALLQIGACAFDPERPQSVEELMADSFLVSISRQFYDGLREESYWKVDASSVQWWSEQPEEARAALNLELVSSPREALMKFSDWLKAMGFSKVPRNALDAPQIWANPPTFDLAILNHGFDVCGLERPWHFRQEKDARTLMWVALNAPGLYSRIQKETEGLVAHRGDHDAIWQAIYIQSIFRRVGPWGK